VTLLLVHNFYAQEGGENEAFRRLRQILLEHGHRLVEYTRESSEIGRDPASMARAAAEAFYSRRTLRDVHDLVRRERPRAALVQNVLPLISPSIYSALRDERVPIAQLVYNYRLVCPDAHLFTAGRICERCLGRNFAHAVIHRCYRGSFVLSAWYAGILGWHRARSTFAAIDRFLLPDDFMRGKLAEGGLPADRMRVVGTPFVLPDRPAPRDEGFVLFVGRLVPQKGILTLVEAMGRMERRDARLIVVGDGPLRSDAAALAERAAPGRVEFLGPLFGDAMRETLQRCAFLCLPSEWYDNAPLVLHEAYAAGKPIIASRIDGIPEIVADGTDGMLVPPRDASALAAAIDTLLADPERRRRLGEAARRKAESLFAPAAYYRRLRAALEPHL
jgi:glycosyltransferase involved in cell wall biosynthesis